MLGGPLVLPDSIKKVKEYQSHNVMIGATKVFKTGAIGSDNVIKIGENQTFQSKFLQSNLKASKGSDLG